MSRFDGLSWKTYSVEQGLGSCFVNTLALDPSGRVWAGTGYSDDPGGVSFFEDSRWISWDTKDVLAYNVITALLSDQHGDVWVGTGGGVNRIRGSEWTCWRKEDGLGANWIAALRLDGAGKVWALTPWGNGRGGLGRFDGSGWTNWNGISQGFDGRKALALFPDASGDMIAQLNSGVLLRFKDARWEPWTTLEPLKKATVRCSLVDPFGNLWIGTEGSWSDPDATVTRFDGTQWTTWSAEEGLLGAGITALLSDELGNVWVGLTPKWEMVSADFGAWVEDGVGRFDGSEWKVWTQEEGLASNWVNTLLMDSMGNLWVGTRDGVSRYDGATWQIWTRKHGVTLYDVQVFVEDPYGHIWSGGYGGLSMFNGSDWKRWTTEDGLASNNIQNLLVDASGRLWVGTESGLSMYAPRTAGIAPTHQDAALPRSVALSPNYPNPFNSTTVIRFKVPGTTQVRLVLYNVLGQRVRTLIDAKHDAGTYAVRWDGKDDAGQEVASGVYIGRLEAGGSVDVRKLVLLR